MVRSPIILSGTRFRRTAGRAEQRFWMTVPGPGAGQARRPRLGTGLRMGGDVRLYGPGQSAPAGRMASVHATSLGQLWHEAITAEQLPPRLLVLCTAAAALILVGWRRAWPLSRTVVTIAHEGGHALVALAVGRRLDGVRVHRSTAGLTVSAGNASGPGIVATAAAGYLAPPLLGLGAAALLATGYLVAALLLSLVLLAALALMCPQRLRDPRHGHGRGGRGPRDLAWLVTAAGGVRLRDGLVPAARGDPAGPGATALPPAGPGVPVGRGPARSAHRCSGRGLGRVVRPGGPGCSGHQRVLADVLSRLGSTRLPRDDREPIHGPGPRVPGCLGRAFLACTPAALRTNRGGSQLWQMSSTTTTRR